MMIVDNTYEIGDLVFLVTDPGQYERMIVAFTVRNSGIFYEVALGETSTFHSDLELSSEKDLVKATANGTV
jgi:hypothetical protein